MNPKWVVMACWISSTLTAYADDAPRVLFAWAPGPLDVRIAFDKPLDKGSIKALEGRRIFFGPGKSRGHEHVTDHGAHRHDLGSLRIAAARLIDGAKVLALTTDPQPIDAEYTIDATGVADAGGANVDRTIAYRLRGVDLSWGDGGEDAKPTHVGWRSTLDVKSTEAKNELNRLPSLGADFLEKPGRLTFTTQLAAPKGPLKLRIKSNRPIEVELGSTSASGTGGAIELELESADESTWRPLSIRFNTTVGAIPLAFSIEWKHTETRGFEPIPVTSLVAPWLPMTLESSAVELVKPESAKLLGGDSKLGEVVFKGNDAKCSTCHAIRGQGGKVGPDLTSQSERDPAEIYVDLALPSARIHPEFQAFTVLLKDGQVAAGIVRAEGSESIRITDSNAKEQVIARAEIDELRPSSTSIMPAGLVGAVGEANVRHLLAYLVSKPTLLAAARPAPPTHGPGPRTKEEISNVIGKGSPKIESSRPLKVLLAAGEKPFSENDHPYKKWSDSWGKRLEQDTKVKVSKAIEWPSKEQWTEADVAVLYFWLHDWTPEKLEQIDSFLERGGGLVVLHSAIVTDGDAQGVAKRLGFGVTTQKRKYLHAEHDLTFADTSADAIISGFSKLHVADEAYWEMTEAAGVKVLAKSTEEGKDWPVVWTFTKGKGRVFGTVYGHFVWTLDDPLYRVLVFRGLAWASGDNDVHRFDEQAVSKEDGKESN